jgi:futalosine hydrolase
MTVLLLTAVPAEASAALAAFRTRATRLGRYEARTAETAAGEVIAVAGGVGPARAAAAATYALAALNGSGPTPSQVVVIVAGIGGGFAGRAAVGDAVVADRIVHADLGADSPGGFLPVAELGFGIGEVACRPDLVGAAATRIGAVVGAVVTVSTVTGTAAGAAELARRYDPAAEGMEGAGGWAAAEAYGVPVLEVRAISNLVGPRDRDGWEIPRALATLRQAMTDLLSEPLP